MSENPALRRDFRFDARPHMAAESKFYLCVSKRLK
jgi:hypothetical protein